MAQRVDYCSESNYEGYTTGLYIPYTKQGQSFTGSNGVLNSVKFYIGRTGSPTGGLTANIYSHSGTFGTSSLPNTLLATSASIDITTIGTAMSLVEFTFSGANKINFVQNTKYVVTLELSGSGTESSRRIDIGVDYPDPTHSGNRARYYTFSSTWSVIVTSDLIFYVYKDDPTLKTHTVDGIVFAHQTKSHTIDGSIEDADSGNPILQENSFLILQEDGVSKILDQSNLRFPEQFHTIDGVIKEKFTETHTLDAIIKERDLTETHTFDGIVKEIKTITHTVDAVVKANNTKTCTIEGIVKANNAETYTVDGLVVNTKKFTHSIDCIVKESKTKTFTIDAIVLESKTKDVTIDGLVRNREHKTHTIDGIVFAALQNSFTIDAVVVENKLNTHTVDAFVAERKSKTHSVDGIVKATNTAQFTIDGKIRIFYTNLSKPTTNYSSIAKPSTNYTNIQKPSTSYTSVNKPTTNYTNRSKPSTIWTEVERPV